MIERKLHVLEALVNYRGVGREAEGLRRQAERGTGDRVGEALAGEVERIEEVGARAGERRERALHEARERHLVVGAAGESDGIVLVVHDRVHSGEWIVDEVAGAAARDAEGVGIGRQRVGTAAEDGAAIPAAKLVGEVRKRLVAARLAVFALEAEQRVARDFPARGEKPSADLVELLVAPAAAVRLDQRRANREAFAERAVHVEGRAEIAPGADALRELRERGVEARLLGRRRCDAAERTVAEEDRVGTAGKVEALNGVAVVGRIVGEEIPLAAPAAGAADIVAAG